MRYRLRTLVVLTAVGPIVIWGVFSFFKLPGTLYWTGIILLTFVICFPLAVLRLYLATRMK